MVVRRPSQTCTQVVLHIPGVRRVGVAPNYPLLSLENPGASAQTLVLDTGGETAGLDLYTINAEKNVNIRTAIVNLQVLIMITE